MTRPYWNDMDMGTWTFRCLGCASTFELLLSERERAGAAAREKGCPECGLVPGAGGDAARGDRRHKIIGYRAANSRPLIL
jgi:hypothetical protein